MMDKEDFKLIASLGDWSDERMGKVFYATYVKVLEKKFEEYEERKTQLKDFVQRNYANVKLPKTPKRMNPAAKLFEQIQTFRMVNFDSDESDDTPVNTQKATRKARIPTQILQQLQNVGIHEEHQTPNLRKHKVPLGKQISGPRAPAIVTAQPIVPRAVTASSTATLSTAASSTILSVHSSASRTVAGNSKILETYKKEQQQLRLKERELAAEKHRMEIINDKKERVRREREERQLRVEANNRLKMAEQQKREQEQREQQERLRVYQLKQKEMEKSVRSPAAKSRKMGTPRSLRKPPVTATIIQQPQIVQKQQFTHDADLIKNSKTHTELENLHNILQSERIPSLGVTEKPANDNSGMEEEMDDADDEGNEDFTENNFNTAEGEDNLQIADVQTTESPQNGNADNGAADAHPVGGMEVEDDDEDDENEM